MEDEGGVLKAATRSSCACVQPLLRLRFAARRVSHLHSHALCSVKLMKTLFCCLWGFILFICGREGWRQSQRFGRGELRSSDKTRSSSDGCATQKVEPSHFPLAATGSVRAFLTGKLSPQTLRLYRPNSYHLHKRCRLYFAFSCIFLLQFFFLNFN